MALEIVPFKGDSIFIVARYSIHSPLVQAIWRWPEGGREDDWKSGEYGGEDDDDDDDVDELVRDPGVRMSASSCS